MTYPIIIALAVICFSPYLAAANHRAAKVAYLEESYYFIEKIIELDTHLNQMQSLQTLSQTLLELKDPEFIHLPPPGNKLSPGSTPEPALALSAWNQAALRSNIHRLDLATYRIYKITQPITRNKRSAPLEFLGEISNLLIGTPSPKKYRKLQLLVQDLVDQGKIQGQTLHGLNNAQKILSSLVNRLVTNSNKNEASNRHLLQVLKSVKKHIGLNSDLNSHVISILATSDTVLYKGEIIIDLVKSALSASKNGLLSPLAISSSELDELFHQKSSSELSPPVGYKNSFFYTNKLTHASIINGSLSIIVRVPLYNKNFAYTIHDTLPSEFNHPLRFEKYLLSKNGFRYLTKNDITDCATHRQNNSIICHKRKITIKPEFRGEIFIHDIDISKVFFHMKNSTAAQIICPHSNEKVIIPRLANITLHPSCGLVHTNFRVWAMLQLPIRDLISSDTHTFQDIKRDIIYLEHSKSLLLNSRVDSIDIQLDNFTAELISNVSTKFALKSDLTLLHQRQNETSLSLQRSDKQQAKINQTQQLFEESPNTTILLATTAISGTALILIIIYLYLQHRKTNIKKPSVDIDTDLNQVFKRLDKLENKLG